MFLLLLTYPNRWYLPSNCRNTNSVNNNTLTNINLTHCTISTLRWFIILLLFNELSIIFVLYFFQTYNLYRAIVKSKGVVLCYIYIYIFTYKCILIYIVRLQAANRQRAANLKSEREKIKNKKSTKSTKNSTKDNKDKSKSKSNQKDKIEKIERIEKIEKINAKSKLNIDKDINTKRVCSEPITITNNNNHHKVSFFVFYFQCNRNKNF